MNCPRLEVFKPAANITTYVPILGMCQKSSSDCVSLAKLVVQGMRGDGQGGTGPQPTVTETAKQIISPFMKTLHYQQLISSDISGRDDAHHASY